MYSFLQNESNQKKKVLFLIFNKGNQSTKKTLLCLQLEAKFKDNENITVKQINFVNGQKMGLKELAKGFSVIFFDEVFEDFAWLAKINQKEIKEVCQNVEMAWLAFSNDYFYNTKLSDSESPESHLKQHFPNFKIVSMKSSLRMPKIISQNVQNAMQNQFGKVKQLSFNQKLAATSMTPTNLVEGSEIKAFGFEKITELSEMMKEATKDLSKDTFSMIVINDSDLQPENQCLNSILKCKICKKFAYALMIDNALEKSGRNEPLYYTNNHSSSEEKIRKWISGEDRTTDIVVSFNLIAGFENDFIIDLTNSAEIQTRCSGQLIRILSNPVIEGLILNEDVFTKDHSCQEIMERGKRPKISTNISDLIGMKTLKMKSFSFLIIFWLLFQIKFWRRET